MFDWELLWESAGAWIGLIVAIAALLYVVIRIRAWFREDEGPAGDVHQLLADASEMHRTGALTDAEYRSIQGRLTRRMRAPGNLPLVESMRSGDPVPEDGSVR
jgi:hypothetical protein